MPCDRLQAGYRYSCKYLQVGIPWGTAPRHGRQELHGDFPSKVESVQTEAQRRTSGKDGLKPDTKVLLTVASKKKSKAGKGDTTKEDESSKNDSAQPVTVSLLFKRYVFDTQKKMIQS